MLYLQSLSNLNRDQISNRVGSYFFSFFPSYALFFSISTFVKELQRHCNSLLFNNEGVETKDTWIIINSYNAYFHIYNQQMERRPTSKFSPENDGENEEGRDRKEEMNHTTHQYQRHYRYIEPRGACGRGGAEGEWVSN